MLTIEETKEMLSEEVSDEEAEDIRDFCYELAELAVDTYLSKHKKDNEIGRKEL